MTHGLHPVIMVIAVILGVCERRVYPAPLVAIAMNVVVLVVKYFVVSFRLGFFFASKQVKIYKLFTRKMTNAQDETME